MSALNVCASCCIINFMETVFRSRGELQARVVTGLLDGFNIPSVLRSQAPSSIYPFTANGMGEYRILVAPELAEEARRIIEAEADEETGPSI